MAITPYINGRLYAWGDIIINFLGAPSTMATKIDYSVDQNITNVYGWGVDPIGYAYGNKTYKGSIEMELNQWQQIVQAAPNGDPMQIPPFNISVIFSNPGAPTVKDVIKSAIFTSNPMNATQGETGLKVTINFIFGAIDRFV